MTAPFRPLVPMLAALVLGACAGPAPVPDPNAEVSPEPKAANKLAEVQTQLGIGYMASGNLELAYNRLNRAIEADPNYSTAHNALGALYERLGNPGKAEEHFRRAVALNPNDSAAQTNYGSFLCRTGRYEEGEQRFLQALKNSLYERPEVAYNNAGLCMKDAGKLDRAESYFRSALQRNPRLPGALLSMAEISFAHERFLPARAYLQRYQEVAEHTAASLWLGVRVERALGDRVTAGTYAMKLKERFPDSQETGLLEKSETQ